MHSESHKTQIHVLSQSESCWCHQHISEEPLSNEGISIGDILGREDIPTFLVNHLPALHSEEEKKWGARKGDIRRNFRPQTSEETKLQEQLPLRFIFFIRLPVDEDKKLELKQELCVFHLLNECLGY